MKNALFVFLLSPIFLLSQDYIPLLQADARWQVSVDETATIWDYDQFYEYTPGQDTVIDNTGYTTVWSHTFFRPNDPGGLEVFPQPFESGEKYLRALLREDLIAQSVFCRLVDMNTPSGFSDEFLLYDFSFEVGDEVSDFLVGAGPYTVESIYTTSIYGMERRVWVLDNGIEITEGVGSSLGLIEGITNLVSGAYPALHRYCQGPAMDCNVEVDGMVNRKRQFNIEERWYDFFGNSSQKTYEYRFLDTVITNGHTYFKLQKRQPLDQSNFTIEDVNPFDSWASNSHLFRQNGDKIYRLFGDEERLIYDFSMQPGESIIYKLDENTQIEFHLIEIDSIELLNGEKRARFEFIDLVDDNTMQWIDGIGEPHHSLYPDYHFFAYPDGLGTEFQCYYDNFEADHIYTAPGASSCYTYIVDNEEIPNEDKIIIHPNPTSGELFLSKSLENGTLTIRTTLGQVVGQFPTDNRSIDLQPIPAGCYFYQIRNDAEQLVTAGKLIKH